MFVTPSRFDEYFVEDRFVVVYRHLVFPTDNHAVVAPRGIVHHPYNVSRGQWGGGDFVVSDEAIRTVERYVAFHKLLHFLDVVDESDRPACRNENLHSALLCLRYGMDG